MIQSTIIFMRHPGGEDEGGSIPENKDDNKATDDIKSSEPKEKSILEKVHDALQDWSNKDQADQAYDDTRP